ncbi:DNA cytosine methyltransferase [Streptomyces sp. NPDC050523]|uniref:DNA cytosine methyltransferase n=1 Tax=Streptomyces sp. NPDC050523 TaxID=3365622 RepID=UPI0037A17EFC
MQREQQLAVVEEAARRLAAYADRVRAAHANGTATREDVEDADLFATEAATAADDCHWLLQEQPKGWQWIFDCSVASARAEIGARVAADLEAEGWMTPERYARLDDDTRRILADYAAPWPPLWLFRPAPGALPRVINLFAGPGGWCEGIRAVLGVDLDMVGVDLSEDACATARAAGYRRIVASVTDLDPEHPALRWVVGLILSPPCQAFSPAGRRKGHEQAAIDLIRDVLLHVGAHAGFAMILDPKDNSWIRVPRSDYTWEEIREPLVELKDKRAGLMAEVAIWPLAMLAAGGRIEWVAMEQSSALPEEIETALRDQFEQAAWRHVEFTTLEASKYGTATRRRRRFLMAVRAGSPVIPTTPTEPIPVTSYAAALEWPAGEEVNTRGERPIDPATGRPKGGNCFSADKPGWCLTTKSRTWKRQSDGLRLNPPDAGRLIGFRADYPWQGSRSSAIEQAADVVSPVISAVVIGRLLGRYWEQPVREHLHRLYKTPLPEQHQVGPADLTPGGPVAAGRAEIPAQQPETLSRSA